MLQLRSRSGTAKGTTTGISSAIELWPKVEEKPLLDWVSLSILIDTRATGVFIGHLYAVALALKEQISSQSVPRTEHDELIDMVICPDEVIKR